jgi:heme exporter protein CcmD
MTSASFVISAYLVTAGGLAAYVARVLTRGRRLSRQVPEGRRRWM